MSDDPRRDDPATPVGTAQRVRRLVGHVAVDIAVAVFWAALVVAIALFSGVVSQFAYVDF